jgi:hypothetical protein
MWRSSSRRSRRGGRRLMAAVSVIALAVFGVAYFTKSWMFADRKGPVDLAATTPPVWLDAPPQQDGEVEAEVELPVLPTRVEFAGARPDTAPVRRSSAQVEEAEAELRPLRSGGDVEALRRRVSALVLDEGYPAEAHAAWLAEARELSKRVVFSASPMKHATNVLIGRGDTLEKICAKLRREQKVATTPRFLELVNDVSASRLRAGTQLKVPTEAMSVLVDKSEFRLYLLLGGVFLKDYRVGTGRDERTPEGRFKIEAKTKNPQWTDPETAKVHRFGEAGHIIGSRWMGFSGDHGRTGFGIHGTTEPGSIGRAESAGCVRMGKDDVEELFDLVPQGSEVVVRR